MVHCHLVWKLSCETGYFNAAFVTSQLNSAFAYSPCSTLVRPIHTEIIFLFQPGKLFQMRQNAVVVNRNRDYLHISVFKGTETKRVGKNGHVKVHSDHSERKRNLQ